MTVLVVGWSVLLLLAGAYLVEDYLLPWLRKTKGPLMGLGPGVNTDNAMGCFWLGVVAIGIVVLVLALSSCGARAHDPETGDPNWITEGKYSGPDNIHCCGPRDCFPLKPDRVKATPQGFVLLDYGGEIVPYAEATPSEDGRFWRCQKSTGERRCMFAPIGTQ